MTIRQPSPTANGHSLAEYEQWYRELYTTQAASYDQARFSRPNGHASHVHEQHAIFDLLELQPGQHVLDAPTGTGRIAAHLAERGLQVTGLDLTRNMLYQAQARADAESLEIHFVEGNGRILPFADAQFDAVISIRFLHLLPVALHRPFVLEMWRVLRPGGVLLVEFDSALAGGMIALSREAYRRVLQGAKPRYYLWPHQIERVFDGIGPLSLHGAALGGRRFLRTVAPRPATTIEAWCERGPRSFLCNKVFVRARKPGVAAA